MVGEEEAYDWGVGVGRGKYFERSGRKTVERLIEYKWLGVRGISMWLENMIRSEIFKRFAFSDFRPEMTS